MISRHDVVGIKDFYVVLQGVTSALDLPGWRRLCVQDLPSNVGSLMSWLRWSPCTKHETTFLVRARLRRNELDPMVFRYESLVLQGLTIDKSPEWRVSACECYTTGSVHRVQC